MGTVAPEDETEDDEHLKIEDYALIGDLHTAALVGRNGSIDWLCFPRFDSGSVFGALLGGPEQGRWLLAPEAPDASATRGYLGDTFVLETIWETDDGAVSVIEVMPTGDRRADVIRRVTGLRGTVRMRQELVIRFDYGTTVPWVRRINEAGETGLLAVAGPDAVLLRGPVPSAIDRRHRGTFEVREGETVDLVLTWYPSHRDVPVPLDVNEQITRTRDWWQDWADRGEPGAVHPAHVRRSLLMLRALTHEDTGGIVAAATTSLPEEFGGVRNWDYRYCWLRDTALTLEALIGHGYTDEALRWRNWLLRAIAGDPEDVQIMYGLAGERSLPELELTHLPGYEGSRPVRIGNGAVGQYQADVLGEVMVALENTRRAGVKEDEFSWPLQCTLLGFVEENWERPDQGIWEVRGPEQHFTHSKVMIWAAFDRGVKAVLEHGLDGPADRWTALRDQVRDQIEREGWDEQQQTYTQYFGGGGVDASLLQIAQVGFHEPTHPRMLATVAALERELLRDGLLMRYRTEEGVDGLPPGEHPFLACSFWLAEQYARSGRTDDARALMDRLVGFANDVGMLSEEYDVTTGRQAGNTPQALSHLALVRAADALDPDRRGRLGR
jgi:GH15 family glucan-1,4-alpha-glucosidase